MPELGRGRYPYLRGGVVRRRAASESALSSGQHSLAGGVQISGTATPLRRALTGGKRQLRPETGNRRRADHWNSNSEEEAFRRRWAAPLGLVQKVFTIFDTFLLTNYTYRGIIVCIQPKLKNFVK